MCLYITPSVCIAWLQIGTAGHSVVPVVNSAVQKWTEYTGKRVTYVLKGQNCKTEMYSALSAEVPMEDDPATFADNELIARLFAKDRVSRLNRHPYTRNGSGLAEVLAGR